MTESLAPLIALISNPKSGHNVRKGLDDVIRIADAARIRHYQASSPESIEDALKQIAVTGADIVAVNGGDGTVNLVLLLMRGLFENEPSLALLKGGTTNMIHGDCGLSGTPAQALRRLLRGPLAEIERCPLEIHTDGAPPLYGFFLGTGAIPRAILQTRKLLHKWNMTGRLGEALAAAYVLARLKFRRSLDHDAVLKPSPLTWHTEHGEQSLPHIFMGLTSLKKLILGLKFNPPAAQIALFYMGDDRRLQNASAHQVTLDLTEAWVLDGEIYGPGKIHLRLGPPIHFMVEG